ncbi:MmcQ/YjbR family DNA-binding protein [Dactylosporangium sp. NPDC051541]|uniref:MmcQ/YjbR family DNA-binding protein n=1 Tax=Dactylosporangium sp. NPDC051541 TaxID=3363977 RepID=UPI0037BA448B
MVTLDEVAELASRLPEVVEGESRGNRSWDVAGKTFAWERPFSKADIKRFGGAEVPAGPILAIVVADLGEKEAVLAQERPGFFTIPHFNGYAAVLVRLEAVHLPHLEESLVDGWLAKAPPRLADAFLAER